MERKKQCEINVTIFLPNNLKIEGTYDFKTCEFIYSKTVLFEESFYQSLKLISLEDDEATISYMFSSNYLSTRFHLSKDKPIEITDYISLQQPKLENVRAKIKIDLLI